MINYFSIYINLYKNNYIHVVKLVVYNIVHFNHKCLITPFYN